MSERESLLQFLPTRAVRAMTDDDLVWEHAAAAFRVKQFDCPDRDAERTVCRNLAAEIDRRKL